VCTHTHTHTHKHTHRKSLPCIRCYASWTHSKLCQSAACLLLELSIHHHLTTLQEAPERRWVPACSSSANERDHPPKSCRNLRPGSKTQVHQRQVSSERLAKKEVPPWSRHIHKYAEADARTNAHRLRAPIPFGETLASLLVREPFLDARGLWLL